MAIRVGMTGSQFFSPKNRPGGDYDFYCQDSPTVRAALLAAGYRSLPVSGEAGPNMSGLFRLGDMGTGHVDVALMHDFRRKHFENRLMTLTPFRILAAAAPKAVRTRLWRIMESL